MSCFFSSEQPKAKDCFNVMFPHNQQKLADKMVVDLECDHHQRPT